MNNSRFPKALIEYHPRGRRRPGWALKRLLDGVQIETETGHMGLISWWNTTTDQIVAQQWEPWSHCWNTLLRNNDFGSH
jgi:hypothetical protein